MRIERVSYQEKYECFVHEVSFNKNTAFVALNNNMVLASASFIIEDHKNATLLSVNNFQKVIPINLFTDEFFYWNPFVETIKYQDNTFKNEKVLKVFKINIEDIRIQQLSVNQNKLVLINQWITSEEDIVINVIKLDKEIFCIDGNTRLMCAYLKGFKSVYCYFEEDYDENDFREFKRWCENEKIYHISDLKNRVVCETLHQKIWIDRCQKYFKQKNGSS